MSRRIEISIAVQQRVLLADTECGDQAIDGLADGMATAPQHPIVSSCFSRQVDAAGCEHLQLEQLPRDIGRGFLVANALEHFAHDQVHHAKPLAIELCVQPLGLRLLMPRLRHSAATRLLEITLPRNFAVQAANAPLAARLDHQTQSFLDRSGHRGHRPFAPEYTVCAGPSRKNASNSCDAARAVGSKLNRKSVRTFPACKPLQSAHSGHFASRLPQ